MSKRKITVARGNGIGPEIMESTLAILEAAGAQIELEEIEIGEEVYKRGISSGIEDSAWDSLRRTKVFLKAPITTPQGKGFKSLNVTVRKTMGLYANVRPVRSLHPYVKTFHPNMDMVIVRENEEDLYAGIEHRQTEEVYQALKLVSKPGTERIIRYAFEYARAYGRKKVTAFTKDNIMKLADGLFHKEFDRIAKEYPEIENEHMIVDIGSAMVADRPGILDVVVTLNLYGDIISDIAAQVTGSVGLAGSANIGDEVAMFEAIHGSAPDIAGKGIANPSGLLNGALMMLVHIGQNDIAQKIGNAWLKTIEDGIHTLDIYKDNFSKEKVNTKSFTQAVIDRLGEDPTTMAPFEYKDVPLHLGLREQPPKAEKKLIGVDVFLDWDEDGRDPLVLGEKLKALTGDNLFLKIITNRGVLVWPDFKPETFRTDHWRCRFYQHKEQPISNQEVADLLTRLANAGFDFIKTEGLYYFGDERGFSLGQGE